MRWQTFRTTPYEMGFGALIDLEANIDFVGRAALTRLAAIRRKRRRVGLTIDGSPPLVGHPAPLFHRNTEVGFVSEWAFSKRLGRTIAVGVAATDLPAGSDDFTILIDNTSYAAQEHDIPFVV